MTAATIDTTAAGIYEVDAEVRRYAEQGKTIFSLEGIYYNGPRGWLRDAVTRVDVARDKLQWLDGHGRHGSQLGRRERVAWEVFHELQVAAGYVVRAAASTDLNRKPNAALLAWASEVSLRAAYYPTGDAPRHAVMERLDGSKF